MFPRLWRAASFIKHPMLTGKKSSSWMVLSDWTTLKKRVLWVPQLSLWGLLRQRERAAIPLLMRKHKRSPIKNKQLKAALTHFEMWL